MTSNLAVTVLLCLCLILHSCKTKDTSIIYPEPNTGVKNIGDTNLLSHWSDLEHMLQQVNKDQKYSVEDFARNPEKTSFQISPDATYFSYLANYKNRMNLFIQHINTNEIVQISYDSIGNIIDYFWKSDSVLIYSKDKLGDENAIFYSYQLKSNKHKCLTPWDSVKVLLVDKLVKNESEIMIAMNKENVEWYEPYTVNVVNGDIKKIGKLPKNPSSYITDNNGMLRVVMTSEGCEQHLYYREKDNEAFKKISSFDCYITFSPWYFSGDNKKLFAISDNTRDKAALVSFDPSTSKENVIFQHEKVDLSDVIFSEYKSVLAGITFNENKKEWYCFDSLYKHSYQLLLTKFPKSNISLVSAVKNDSLWIISVSSDVMSDKYYVLNTFTQDLKLLAETRPWINENDMTERIPVSYESRDGINIPAYLMIPKNFEGKKAPVVILPHGGPWSRVYWKFDPWAQFLCSRGYAVFLMNFRGSTGYGKNFVKLSRKEWGGKIQEDITDGTKWLIKNNLIDSNRIAILGGSFGGFSSWWGLSKEAHLYKCGVSLFGVSDLVKSLKNFPRYWKSYEGYMFDMVGNYNVKEDSLMLMNQSPISHLEKIVAPVLVLHGSNDARVKIEESDNVVRILRQKNIDVPYWVFYNEGHGFMNEENKILTQKLIEAFLSKYLK